MVSEAKLSLLSQPTSTPAQLAPPVTVLSVPSARRMEAVTPGTMQMPGRAVPAASTVTPFRISVASPSTRMPGQSPATVTVPLWTVSTLVS